MAIDLFNHGEHQAAPLSDYDDLTPDEWDTFVCGSIERLELVIKHVVQKAPFDQHRIGYLSYSIGGVFGLWLASRQMLFNTMVMCVPPGKSDGSTKYAPSKNLKNLDSIPMLIVAGEYDEYILFEDSQRLYDQLPMRDKRYLSYPSGHSLPIDYVSVAVEWFTRRL